MAKPIRLTATIIDDIKEKFLSQIDKALDGKKLFDGKVTFSETYSWKDDEKATIVFSTKAFLKMFKLIQEFSDEVAWHGVAHRDSEDESVFYITDILVYPQEVTGATVNTDQNEYQNWLMNLDDEVFNNLRMQGHSHVNMAPNPSSVDTTHQESILQCLDDDMFYIFMIWNKSLSRNIKIFDLKNNTLYENNDIDVGFTEMTEDDCKTFISESKELVKRKSYSYTYNNTQKTQSTTSVESIKSGIKASDGTQKKTVSETKEKNGVGSGWKGRGLDSLEEYYDDYPYTM